MESQKEKIITMPKDLDFFKKHSAKKNSEKVELGDKVFIVGILFVAFLVGRMFGSAYPLETNQVKQEKLNIVAEVKK